MWDHPHVSSHHQLLSPTRKYCVCYIPDIPVNFTRNSHAKLILINIIIYHIFSPFTRYPHFSVVIYQQAPEHIWKPCESFCLQHHENLKWSIFPRKLVKSWRHLLEEKDNTAILYGNIRIEPRKDCWILWVWKWSNVYYPLLESTFSILLHIM